MEGVNSVKRGNKKKILRGLPLIYKTKQTSIKHIPYSYKNKEDGKVYDKNNNVAKQKNILKFKNAFLKYSKKKNFSFSIENSIDLALDTVT